MYRKELQALASFSEVLKDNPPSNITNGDLAHALDLILALFVLVEHDLTNVEACVDALAAHTGYQLKEKTLNPEG